MLLRLNTKTQNGKKDNHPCNLIVNARKKNIFSHYELPTIAIISGLSGSGKTVALRALEDSGFFCADNLPVTLIDSFVSIVSKNTDIKKIGIGVDIREKGFLSGLKEVLKALRNKYRTEVLFLEAEQDVLVRR